MTMCRVLLLTLGDRELADVPRKHKRATKTAGRVNFMMNRFDSRGSHWFYMKTTIALYQSLNGIQE